MTKLSAAPQSFRKIRRTLHLQISSAALALLAPFAVHAFDLADAYQLSKEYDPTIQAAIATYEAATKQLPLARSAFRPQINLSADASLSDIDDDFSDTFSSTSLTLVLSQSIYNRRNSAFVDQAGFSVLQADATLAEAQQDLILRVTEAYFDVLRAEAEVAFTGAELQAIGRQKDQAEKRFDVGLATVIDVRDAQAQFDLAVALEVAAVNAEATALEALRVITGTDEEKLDPLKDSIALVTPKPADIERWVEIARNQNLDLSVARFESQAAGVQIRAERGERFPTLDVLAIGSASSSDQTGRSNVTAGELRLELNLPLYTGGGIKSEVARAKAEARAAEARLRAAELSAIQNARDSYRGVVTSISQVLALRQALDSTQKSVEAADAGFRAGTQDSLEVLRALRDTFQARTDYVNARYDYVLNTLNLKAASGTLNERDLLEVNALLKKASE